MVHGAGEDTDSPAAATHIRGARTQVVLADIPAVALMDVATPVAAMAEAVTTVDEATMAGAATADITAAAALALGSGFTARLTPMDTATPPAIAARPATMIGGAIGFPIRAASLIPTERW